MAADPTVRPARPGDAAAVVAVARASWHAAYDDFLGADAVDETIEDWYDADRLAAAADEDDLAYVVAERDGEVVGFAYAGRDRYVDETGVAHLYRIYVHPDHWGDGAGTALLDRTERDLRDSGYDRLRLVVFAENGVGVSFYEASGFERVGERDETFDGESHVEYVYEKEL